MLPTSQKAGWKPALRRKKINLQIWDASRGLNLSLKTMKKIFTIFTLITLLISSITFFFFPQQKVTASGKATVEWIANTPSSSGEFKQAISPQEIVFPRDLGPHKDYQTEWWYYTGNSWKSPKSGRKYPSKWRINIPKLALSLEGQPLMLNQELDISTIYWEGAVGFRGEMKGKPVEAKGYIEMTGYANNSLTDIL